LKFGRKNNRPIVPNFGAKIQTFTVSAQEIGSVKQKQVSQQQLCNGSEAKTSSVDIHYGNKVIALRSIIRPGRSRLLEFEKKLVLVV
jgi:hypothetical protein